MELELLMPMGGAGVRFEKEGVTTPKPLIGLWGRPFFWWAAQSVLRAVPVRRMVFVVLRRHAEEHGIVEKISAFYPKARFVLLEEILAGPVLTCEAGLEAVSGDAGLIINDCDHLFWGRRMADFFAAEQKRPAADGALLTFESQNPAYSYARLDDAGRVTGTVEKQVVSNAAICGAYYFRSKAVFAGQLEAYKQNCPYNELFVSGIYDQLAKAGGTVRAVPLEAHLSFGTPAEYAAAKGWPRRGQVAAW